MATALAHVDDDGAGRRVADLAVAIRAHLVHLCAILVCTVVGTLLAVIGLAELPVGGRGHGLLAVVLALAAGAFLTGVPYCLCHWWHFVTTGRDDWMVK